MNLPLHASPESPSRFRVQTPFGHLEADAGDVIDFPDGLPGFEQHRRFVLMAADATSPVRCLQAVDGPPVSFLAIDPRLVLPNYRYALTPKDRTRLGPLSKDGALLWLALLTVDEQAVVSANLRAPVVVNPEWMVGYQVLPHNSLYPLRFPLDLA
jgi:flagellar assembly factor FliW